VLGEEQDEGEALAYESETPEVASDESLFGYEEESRPDWLGPAGGGHELTLDDLKKAPAEYRELPGPRDEPESSAAPVTASAGWDPSGGPGDDVPEAPEGALPPPDREGEAPSEVAAEEVAAEEAEWPEPTIAEVEAAADQLAEEFRDAEEPSEVEAELLSDLDEPSGPRTVRVGATESLTGPTWEEPTSQPIMGETSAQGPGPGTGPGRNMTAAVGTAVALALGAVVTLLIAKWLFVIMAGAVVILGQFELYATMQRRGHRPATALGLAVGGFMLAGAYRKGEPAISFFLALGLLLSFLWYMAAPLKARENLIRNIGSTMLGILYVPMLAGYVFMLLAQPHSGRALMLTVIGLAFVYDISAYGFGSFWGSRPLAPTISPRKSWEGLFGATVITFALAIVLVPAAVDYLTLTRALGLALVIIVFAPLGDLVESLIKRDLGVKDMGSVLPGHGGVLDRIDSVLLVAPAAFYYIRLIF
jgi:phosphatidate cytidylyltransferase